jgi:hypothetical protein
MALLSYGRQRHRSGDKLADLGFLVPMRHPIREDGPAPLCDFGIGHAKFSEALDEPRAAPQACQIEHPPSAR